MSDLARRCTMLFLALWLMAASVSADSAAPLQERMTRQQFEAAGLHKLDAGELAALNAWLSGDPAVPASTAATASAPAQTANSAIEPSEVVVPAGYTLVKSDSVGTAGLAEPERTEILSEIEGSFSGWNGATVFNLTNGQVWQQNERGTVKLKERTGVTVRIKPRMMGNWRMKVDGSNQWVEVKRIR